MAVSTKKVAFVRKIADVSPSTRPYTIAVDSAGNLYFSDENTVRMIAKSDPGTIHIIAGSQNDPYYSNTDDDGGPATSANLGLQVKGLFVSKMTGEVYITIGSKVRVISSASSPTANRTIDTVAGKCESNRKDSSFPSGVRLNAKPTCLPDLEDMVGDPRTDTLYVQAITRPYVDMDVTSYYGDPIYQILKLSTRKRLIRSIFKTTDHMFHLSCFHPMNWAAPGTEKHRGGTLFITEPYTHNLVFALTAKDGRYLGIVAGSGIPGSHGDNGPATSAGMYYPYGVAVGPNINGSHQLYVTESSNGLIRQVDLSSGIISTVAGIGSERSNETLSYSGDGVSGTDAYLSTPIDLHFVRSNGGTNDAMYIVENNINMIRKVSFTSSYHNETIISTVAGTVNPMATSKGENVSATSSYLNTPRSVAVDVTRNLLYFAEYNRIRCVDLSTGLVNTVINADKDSNLVIDSTGDIYYVDDGLYVVNKATTSKYVNGSVTIERIAGTGVEGSLLSSLEGEALYANTTALPSISSLSLDESTNTLFLSSWSDAIIFTIDLTTKLIDIIAGIGPEYGSSSETLCAQSNMTVESTASQLYSPVDIWLDKPHNYLYFIEWFMCSRIRRVDLTKGLITTIAVLDSSYYLRALEGDPSGNVLYAADQSFGKVFAISLLESSYGDVSTLVGRGSYYGVTDMPTNGIARGRDTPLYFPESITYDPVTRSFYFIDLGAHGIYRLYYRFYTVDEMVSERKESSQHAYLRH